MLATGPHAYQELDVVNGVLPRRTNSLMSERGGHGKRERNRDGKEEGKRGKGRGGRKAREDAAHQSVFFSYKFGLPSSYVYSVPQSAKTAQRFLFTLVSSPKTK